MKQALLILSLIVIGYCRADTYYVSTTGSDSNAGTISAPWATWQKAFNTAMPGDTVFFRGGVWAPIAKQPLPYRNAVTIIAPDDGIGHDGEEDNPICYFNYPGETPILDCINITHTDNFITGLGIKRTQYLHFKGLTIRNVKQDANYVEVWGLHANECNNMIYENMTFYQIDGNALRATDCGYYSTDGINYSRTDNSYMINCDVYECCDSLPRNETEVHIGGSADGLKFWSAPWTRFYIRGCRTWKCSDDGFDCTNGVAIFENCWSFQNGYLEGDGTGFKTGGISSNMGDTITRIVVNCVSAYNDLGFFQLEYAGYYRTKIRFYNNISFHDKWGWMFSSNGDYPTPLGIYRNNIVYQCQTEYYDFINTYQTYTESHNSWAWTGAGTSWPQYIHNPNFTITDDDFESLDVEQLKSPRKADGSLPDVTFAKLKSTSDLIDAGTQIPSSDSCGILDGLGFYSLDYYGSSPDIGWKEYIPASHVGDSIIINSSQMLADSLANNRHSGDVIYLAVGTLTDTFDIEVGGLTIMPYTGYNPHVPKFNVIADSINILNMSIGSLNITGDYVFIDSNTLSNSTSAIRSTNNKYITIRNCEFENNDTTLIVNRVANLIFRNNTVNGDGEAIVFQNKTTWFPTMVIDYNTYTGDLKFDGKRFWWYQNKYYKLEFDKHSTYSKN